MIDGTEQDCQVTNNTLYRNEIQHNGDGEIRLQIGSGNLVENNIIVARHGVPLIDGTFGSGNNTSTTTSSCAPGDPTISTYEWNNFLYTGLSLYHFATGQDLHSGSPTPCCLTREALVRACRTSHRPSTPATQTLRPAQAKPITSDKPDCKGRQLILARLSSVTDGARVRQSRRIGRWIRRDIPFSRMPRGRGSNHRALPGRTKFALP